MDSTGRTFGGHREVPRTEISMKIYINHPQTTCTHPIKWRLEIQSRLGGVRGQRNPRQTCEGPTEGRTDGPTDGPTCSNLKFWIKQGRIHGNPVADGWAGAVMRKPLAIQKYFGRTDRRTDGRTDKAAY